MEALRCSHFEGEVDDLALDLIGRQLTVRDRDSSLSAVVIETEAYGGPEDPASHAAFRPGGRAAVMADAPGTVYIYAAYGMYPCFNIVCGPEGRPSAILVRGVWMSGSRASIFGPGRVSRALGITLQDHGMTACSHRFTVSSPRLRLPVVVTGRIGITRGIDIPWRFVADVMSLKESQRTA